MLFLQTKHQRSAPFFPTYRQHQCAMARLEIGLKFSLTDRRPAAGAK
jgi:hypothetical protein